MHTVCTKNLPISCLFNRTACFVLFLFTICSFLLVINSYSVQFLFEVRVHFLAILKLFYVVPCSRLSCMWQFHFYNLLKSEHASQQFVCDSKNDSESLTASILIVFALASQALLNRTLCLCAFLLMFFQLLCTTVHQVLFLPLEDTYFNLIDYTCGYGECVSTYPEWNRTTLPCVVDSRFMPCLFDIHSIVV